MQMSIPDKIAAATRISEFLTGVVSNSGLRVKYRITVDPPLPEERDWERPEILVEFTGPDSNVGANCFVHLNCWPWKCCAFLETSTRKFALTA
jgi:hypothetical protein